MSPRHSSSSSDEPRSRSDDPDVPPAPKKPRARRPSTGPPPTPTSDEISVMLSSAMTEPEPDPMLGGASSWDLARIAREQAAGGTSRDRSSDRVDIGVETAAPVIRFATAGGSRDGSDAAYSWSGVILRSYASAVTLALIWVLWTGKTIPKGPAPAATSREAPALRRRAVEPPLPASDLPGAPAGRTTTLGEAIVVDDLEILPLVVLHKSVRISRDLGEERLVRDHDDCLFLTLRLKNLSSGESLQPLDVADLLDGEAFAIEAPPGARLGLFTLGPRTEWTVDEQTFPAIAPGESEDVVLVSEPVPSSRLGPNLTWRFRVRTAADRPERADVAVRFGRGEIHGDGG